MKNLFFAFLLFSLSFNSFAGKNSEFGIPEAILVFGDVGFRVISSDFGNPMACGIPGQILVRREHPQYQEIYSTVLAAYVAKKRIRLFVNTCEVHSWISTNSLNTLVADQKNQIDIRD